MKIRILREVPVAIDRQVVRLKPGTEINTLGEGVVASLIRGGDAEEIVETSTATPLAERLFNKPHGKKNRGAAPENK